MVVLPSIAALTDLIVLLALGLLSKYSECHSKRSPGSHLWGLGWFSDMASVGLNKNRRVQKIRFVLGFLMKPISKSNPFVCFARTELTYRFIFLARPLIQHPISEVL